MPAVRFSLIESDQIQNAEARASALWISILAFTVKRGRRTRSKFQAPEDCDSFL